MNLISCSNCKQCNIKGKPSVMRGSKYCDEHNVKKIFVKSKFNIFTSIKDKLFDRRYDREQNKMKNTKGFRSSWFER